MLLHKFALLKRESFCIRWLHYCLFVHPTNIDRVAIFRINNRRRSLYVTLYSVIIIHGCWLDLEVENEIVLVKLIISIYLILPHKFHMNIWNFIYHLYVSSMYILITYTINLLTTQTIYFIQISIHHVNEFLFILIVFWLSWTIKCSYCDYLKINFHF